FYKKIRKKEVREMEDSLNDKSCDLEKNDSDDMDEAKVDFGDRSYQIYVKQIRKNPLLTSEQEFKLGEEIVELEDLIYLPVSWGFVEKTWLQISSLRKKYVIPNLLLV